MKTTTSWTIAVGLFGGTLLATGLHAQMGQMNGMSNNGGMMQGHKSEGMTHGNMMGGMMGPMRMNGSVTMNGRAYPVQCRMAPSGTSRSMMGTMGDRNMGRMKMNHPAQMSGTMTMMGHTYRCTMTMTPQGK